jgi:plasmid stabilization system protein ParE
MQVRWTTAAAASDLENIADYLFEKTAEHAARLTAVVVVYNMEGGAAHIVRILHSAQDKPR